MSKRTYVLVMAFALAAVLATGVLLASNMGFKVLYTFNGAGVGGAAVGETHFALPFYPHLGLTNAQSLKGDIESGAGCTAAAQIPAVQRFNPLINARESWFGAKIGGTNFDITPCESYFVQAAATTSCDYLIVGTHNPNQDCVFNGAGVSGYLVGENPYSLPFHTTASNAGDLLTELADANFVQRFNQSTNNRESWFGAKIGGTNFTVTPGEGYFVQMAAGQTTTVKAAHY
jgi:hypothetical protein